MKFYLIFLFLLFSKSIYPQTNSDSIIIKNKVREVRVLDINKKIACLTKYDSIGRLTYNLMDDFTGQTSLKSSIEKIYDEKGNQIKTIFTHSSYSNPSIWINEFDSKNNKISTKNDSGNLIFEYFYDDSNFLVKTIAYDEDNNEIRRIETTEKLINEMKIVTKMTKDSTKYRVNTKYLDKKGNIIKLDSFDGENLNFSSISEYNNLNQITKETYNSKYGNYYIYNSNNQIIKRQQFEIKDNIEILTKFEEFEYNDLGLISKYRENIYSKNLREYSYEYEFYK